jgi:hypothetical protein
MYYGASGTSILDEEKVLVVKDGEDGNDGVRGTGTLPITTLPTAYTTTVNGITSAYRIALSTVKSESKATEVLVGDILESSYYHYPVIYVSSDYVYCGTRRSIQGEQGEPGLVAKSVFDKRYEIGSTGSVKTSIFNRTPKIGEIFTNLCANTYYTTFEVTAVNEGTVSIKSTNEISYTTRNGIVDALNKLDSIDDDGIYQTGSGKIGINASAIKTGCITFGDNSDWYIDPFNVKGEDKYLNLPGLNITDTAATFEGHIIAERGSIAGWKLDTDRIENESGVVGLYSGAGYKFSSLLGSGDSKLRFFAGSKPYTTEKEDTMVSKGEFTSGWTDFSCSFAAKYKPNSVNVLSIEFTNQNGFPIHPEYDYDTVTYGNTIFVRIYLWYPPSTNGYANVSISYSYYDTPQFAVLEDGSLYASALRIDGGTIGSNNSILLSTTNMAGASGFFDGTSINNWRMTVGSNFGVTSDGTLYCSNLVATGGKIGELELIEGALSAVAEKNAYKTTLSASGIV